MTNLNFYFKLSCNKTGTRIFNNYKKALGEYEAMMVMVRLDKTNKVVERKIKSRCEACDSISSLYVDKKGFRNTITLNVQKFD